MISHINTNFDALFPRKIKKYFLFFLGKNMRIKRIRSCATRIDIAKLSLGEMSVGKKQLDPYEIEKMTEHPMIRITASTSAAAAMQYFGRDLLIGDYYALETAGTQVPAVVGGRGAAMLGLADTISPISFENLLNNNTTDGNKLTSRNVKGRRPGYDFTFDCPKSVSILYAIGKDTRIAEAMRKAIQATMIEIEENMHTRVRINGQQSDRKTGNIIWVFFQHETTRPSKIKDTMEFTSKRKFHIVPDPHLHAHVFVINATYDSMENKWKAGEFVHIKENAYYYQSIYHSRLAHELQRIGYKIKPTKHAFEIDGISNETLNKFSRRTKIIEEVSQKLGIIDPKMKSEIGILTRLSKRVDMSSDDMKNIWNKMLHVDERHAINLIASDAKVNMNKSYTESINNNIILDLIRKELSSNQIKHEEKRLISKILNKFIGTVTVDKIKKIVNLLDCKIIQKDNDGAKCTPSVSVKESTINEAKSISKSINIISFNDYHELNSKLVERYCAYLKQKNNLSRANIPRIICDAENNAKSINYAIHNVLKNIHAPHVTDRFILKLKPILLNTKEKYAIFNYTNKQLIEVNQNIKGVGRGERLRILNTNSNTGIISVLNNYGQKLELSINNAKYFNFFNVVKFPICIGEILRPFNNIYDITGKYKIMNGTPFIVQNFDFYGNIVTDRNITISKENGFLDYGYGLPLVSAKSCKSCFSYLLANGALLDSSDYSMMLLDFIINKSRGCTLFTDNYELFKNSFLKLPKMYRQVNNTKLIIEIRSDKLIITNAPKRTTYNAPNHSNSTTVSKNPVFLLNSHNRHFPNSGVRR